MQDKLKIIECPRDAMQGLSAWVPTEKKAAYINQLLQVGFDTIDFGSFVSPKAVPQMRDTVAVLDLLDLSATTAKLLAIVANLRGAQGAAAYQQITYLGYPLSVSETFQQKNTNRSIAQALTDLQAIAEICHQANKQLVVYISMGFGNPYGDPYSPDVVADMAATLQDMGVAVISLADTVGLATPHDVATLFTSLGTTGQGVEWGVHLHATPAGAAAKVQAALEAGCRRIDGAVLGYGGCPMSGQELVGNINTRIIVEEAEKLGLHTGVDKQALAVAEQMAAAVFA